MEETTEDEVKEKAIKPEGSKDTLRPNTYWLTRIVLLRFLAFVYFVAFLVALFQNKALIGKDGILPADKFMTR